MLTRIRFACTFSLALILFLVTPKQSSGQERLCDPSFEDCYSPLLDLVYAENVGIDMAFYMIELPGLANAIISRHQAGVPVRIIVEPRANLKFPGNQPILDQFNAAGIPMRYKLGDGIVHVKTMLLAGQNKVVFTGSNFGDGDVRPYEPYANYVDGAWYISDDAAVVNSFKTRYDDVWTDTATYGNYANINGPPARKYPTHPIDPAMNFLPNQNLSQDYGARMIAQIDQETQKIDLTMYRVTDVAICDALLRALGRGVQVRLLAEPHEYRFDDSRLGAEFTGPYNVDRMHAAGVQIKMRKHRGLNHQKSVSLYGRGLTVFGSSNWSWQSFNYQEEHNYFTTKAWFFQWFVNQFNRKWNSAIEYEPFVPLPPTAPVNISPADFSTTGPASVTLTWEGGRWAHKYDVYFGTNPNSLPLIASDVITGTLGPSGSESYLVSGLQTGSTYYWRIVGKTMANQTATGPVWRFTTSGTPPPATAPTVTGVSPNSGTTAGGTSVTISGANFASGATVTFGGAAATNVNVVSNSSITATTPARPAGAVNVVVTNTNGLSGTLTGGYTYTSPPPPPPASSDVVLYAGEAQVRAGAWVVVSDTSAAGGLRIHHPDAGAAKVTAPSANPAHYFEMTFTAEAGRAYRLWIRGKAQNDFWGNDSIWVQFSDSVNSSGAPIYRVGTTSGTEINLEDCSGCGLSAWGWQDNGWGVGVLGAQVYFQSTGTHTIRVQGREDGISIDQIVLSPGTYLNSSPGALKNDNTILPRSGNPPPPAPDPTVTGASPNSGTTAGGTSVTISGANFASGATVTFGGAAATNVNVVSGSTMTATTPAHAAGAVNVVVMNPGGQSGTLAGGYTYTAPAPQAPTVTSVSPNTGPTAGGTSVTITGTNFATGAALTFGGTAALNVIVTSATTMTASTPAHAVGAVSVAVTNPDGQSGALTNGFTYTAVTETTLLEDNFNDNSIDFSKWTPNNLFSGFTDPNVPTNETSQQMQMGSLLQGQPGSHYNGIRSTNTYDFMGAYCYVELVQAAASATKADAMLTLGRDVSNYYRIYVEEGTIICQARIAGVKRNLFTAAYNPVAHRYWRIRHDQATGKVVFETAPDNSGAPGSWTLRYSEQWDTASVPLATIVFEIKAGTWQAEPLAPGVVIFDNFRTARQL